MYNNWYRPHSIAKPGLTSFSPSVYTSLYQRLTMNHLGWARWAFRQQIVFLTSSVLFFLNFFLNSFVCFFPFLGWRGGGGCCTELRSFFFSFCTTPPPQLINGCLLKEITTPQDTGLHTQKAYLFLHSFRYFLQPMRTPNLLMHMFILPNPFVVCSCMYASFLQLDLNAYTKCTH